MYFVFLWEVLKRAFTPAPRVTDMLQILAASTLPAVTKFAGIELTQSANNDALAYIGLVALSFVVIRLFWAPYSMWKEQEGVIGGLRLELTKPERMVMVRLAKHRAKARAKLAAELEDFQTLAFVESWTEANDTKWAQQMGKIRRLQAQAGLSQAFDETRRRLLIVVKEEGGKPNAALSAHRESWRLLGLLQRHLVGDLTAEALALQLPPDTAAGTQP